MAGLRLITERYGPYLFALAVCVVTWKHPLQIPKEYHADVIGSALSMAAIFLGFMATSLSILISIKESPVADALRTNGSMGLLVSYLRQAIFWTLLWLISSFLLYFQQPGLLLSLWSALACLALLCFLRVVHLLSQWL